MPAPSATLNPAAPTFSLPLTSRYSSGNCGTTSSLHSHNLLAMAPGKQAVEESLTSPSRLGAGWKTTLPQSTQTPLQTHSSPPLIKSRNSSSEQGRPSGLGVRASDKIAGASTQRHPGDRVHAALWHLVPAEGVSDHHNAPTLFNSFAESNVETSLTGETCTSPASHSAHSHQPSQPQLDEGRITEIQHFGRDSDIGEGRNVYLPDLRPNVHEDVLRHVGQMYGRVVSVKVEHSGSVSQESFEMFPEGLGSSGYGRHYAFVMFDSRLAATRFMTHLQTKGIACQYGKETAHLKQRALEDPHSSNLYVAEIPLDASEEEMRQLFAPHTISSLRFLTDDLGNRRGTAMVRLQSRAQAEAAIQMLDLKVLMPGCTKPLQVRIADSENQKQFKKNHMVHRSVGSRDVHRTASATGLPATLPHPTANHTRVDNETLLQHIEQCRAELRRRQEGSPSVSHARTAIVGTSKASPPSHHVDVLESLLPSLSIGAEDHIYHSAPYEGLYASGSRWDSVPVHSSGPTSSNDSGTSGSFQESTVGSFSTHGADLSRLNGRLQYSCSIPELSNNRSYAYF